MSSDEQKQIDALKDKFNSLYYHSPASDPGKDVILTSSRLKMVAHLQDLMESNLELSLDNFSF